MTNSNFARGKSSDIQCHIVDTVLLSKNRPVLSTESQNFLKDPGFRREFRVASPSLIAFALLRGFFQRASWQSYRGRCRSDCACKLYESHSLRSRDDSSQPYDSHKKELSTRTTHHQAQALLKSLAQSDDTKCMRQVFLCHLEHRLITSPAGANPRDKSAPQILTMRRNSNKIFHAQPAGL